jgi:hypothetical protein
MISMGGTSYIPIEKYFERYPGITNITLCLDSDDEGNFFSQKIREKFGEEYEICRHIPKGKDFNEELISFANGSFCMTGKVFESTIIEEECMV